MKGKASTYCLFPSPPTIAEISLIPFFLLRMYADSTVSCVSFSEIHLLAIVLDIGLILVGCILLM